MTLTRAEWVKYGFIPEMVVWVDLEVTKVLDASIGGCLPFRNHLFGPIFDDSMAAPPWFEARSMAYSMSCWWCGKTYYHIIEENPGVMFTFKRYSGYDDDDELCYYELTRLR